MNAWVLVFLPTALGVDFGWERQPDNSIEYIVQIEPEAIDQMKTGTELISSLPPALRNIRNYRIRVGRERLPNQNVLPPEVASAAATAPTSTGWGTSATTPNYQPGSNYPTNSNSGFVNSSLPTRPGTTFPAPTPSGTNPQYYAGTPNYSGTPTSTTSTSGFPMQNPPNGYNAGGYATNPAAGTYPPATTTGWGTTGAAQPTGYPPNYGQPNYAPAGYNPATGYPNNYIPAGYNPNGAPQYTASNPNGVAPNLANDPNYYNGPRLGDPQSYGMAKPSIEMPNPSGTPNVYGGQYAGVGPAGYPTNIQLPPPPNDPRFTNNSDPRAATDHPTTAVAGTAKVAAVEPQSQWASLTFALVGLFASLGANFYLGWTTYHLRERYRMMLSDRVTY
jgi:hypothetical protein